MTFCTFLGQGQAVCTKMQVPKHARMVELETFGDFALCEVTCKDLSLATFRIKIKFEIITNPTQGCQTHDSSVILGPGGCPDQNEVHLAWVRPPHFRASGVSFPGGPGGAGDRSTQKLHLIIPHPFA